MASVDKQVSTVEAQREKVAELKGELESAQGDLRDSLRKLLNDHGKGPYSIGGKDHVIAVRKSQSVPEGTPVLMPDRLRGQAKGTRKAKATAAAPEDGDAGVAQPPKKKGGRKSAKASAAEATA